MSLRRSSVNELTWSLPGHCHHPHLSPKSYPSPSYTAVTRAKRGVFSEAHFLLWGRCSLIASAWLIDVHILSHSGVLERNVTQEMSIGSAEDELQGFLEVKFPSS